jgi:hypothetical protein
MSMGRTHFVYSKMSQKAVPQQVTPAPVFDPTQPKPKRPCSDRQLEVLKQGREMSSLYRLLKSKPKKKGRGQK